MLLTHTLQQLSRVLHPDKNPDERATNAFQKIQHAFERLQDPLKRCSLLSCTSAEQA